MNGNMHRSLGEIDVLRRSDHLHLATSASHGESLQSLLPPHQEGTRHAPTNAGECACENDMPTDSSSLITLFSVMRCCVVLRPRLPSLWLKDREDHVHSMKRDACSVCCGHHLCESGISPFSRELEGAIELADEYFGRGS
jgi:hypothetical protein